MTDQPNTITQPEGGDPVKIGARNNRADMARIQMMHDAAVQLGAACQGDESDPLEPEKALVYFGGEVKALGDGKVGGYLVRFTSEDDTDLTGDYFAKDTDYGDAETSPVYYHHGLDAKMGKRVLGKGTQKKDDIGVWIEAQLQMRDEYEKAVYEMAQAGKLGWSSGTAGHLVERQGSKITRWPLGLDASLTPTPAEPRNNAVPLKSLISAPEASQGEAAAVQNQTQKDPNEVNTMDENEVKIDVDALAQQVTEKAAAALESKFADILTTKAAPAVTRKPKESASWIKAFAAWASGDNPAGFVKSKEITLYPESMKGAWEGGTDNEGGYAVPDDFYNGVVEQRDRASWVRQAPVQKFTTTRDRILVPTESTAGTKLVVTDEEAAYDENEPVFGQVALTVYKFTKMLKISEELMEGDAVGLETYLSSTLARASAKAENYYLTVGTGTGMPQGLAYAPTAGTMMATADTIVASDILTNRGALNSGFDIPGEVGVLMAPATWWYIKGIAGSVFQFSATPAGGPNSLLGDPVYLSPDCEALTVHSGKVITWFNYNAYAFVERLGLTVARNPYLYQANGIVGVFAKQRFGGAVLQALGTLYMPGHND